MSEFRGARVLSLLLVLIGLPTFHPVRAQMTPLPQNEIYVGDSSSVAQPTTGPTFLDRAFCSTVGYVVARTTGGWVCSKTLPVPASYYGVLCNGSTDDAPNLQAAVNAAIAAGAPKVVLPVGTCPLNENVFVDQWAASGILTVPGFKLAGQGKDITILDTRVANGYALSVNPDWKAAHQSLYGITASNTGSLVAGTYYVQITMNDPLGNEIFVTLPKSIAVGSTGSITITLQPVNSGYSYNIYLSSSSTPANYGIVGGSDAVGVAGNQTVSVTNIGSAHAVPTSKLAIWQNADVSDLSISNTTAAANASGILYFKVGYANITNVYMKGLTGDGLDIPDYTGDIDGSFVVTVDKSKFDTIKGWCINTAGAALEFSSFTVSNSAFNICGTAPTNLNSNVTISGITNSTAPVVTTSAAHNWLANDQIYVSVTGMSLPVGWYRVGTVLSSTTLNLLDLNGTLVNTTGLGTFTSGSGKLAWRPPAWNATAGTTSGSGALAWLGLIATFRNLGFTQNNNVNIYVSENGSNDNLTMEGVDNENTNGKGMYIAGLVNGTFNNGECLSSASIPNSSTISCLQLGTGFPGGGVRNFQLNNIKVRNDVTPATAFEQFPNTNIGSTYSDQVRIKSIDWQTFDAAGQARFNGVLFSGISGQAKFSISATNTARLIPTGYGAIMPLHLMPTGEWVEYHIPATGLTSSITGGLSANTTYNFYLSNSALAVFPFAGVIDASATGPTVTAEGYSVKTNDSTRTFIGTATTDGSGNFQPSGAQTSVYPPTATPGIARFHARLDGKAGGVCTVIAAFNVASCTRSGLGVYTINFATPFVNANYDISGLGWEVGTAAGAIGTTSTASFTTTSLTFVCINPSTGVAHDCDIMSLQGFGVQ